MFPTTDHFDAGYSFGMGLPIGRESIEINPTCSLKYECIEAKIWIVQQTVSRTSAFLSNLIQSIFIHLTKFLANEDSVD